VDRRTRVVIDTLLPSGAHPALSRGALDVEIERLLREFQAAAPPRIRTAFRAAVTAATWVAPVLIGRFPPLRLHRRETRERALQAMAGPYLLRQLLGLLKTVVAFAYGADPEVRNAIGYPRQEAPG
jgi:hypothetical protein